MTARVFALVGPTATGKTSLAIPLAQELDAEILVCDSMTVYRGMDVGTAKPTPAERAAVPHHMLDLADPDEDFSVARFQVEARRVLEDLAARGRPALIVGGSGLYLRAVVDDLDFPPTDPATRAALEREQLPALAERLRRDDPPAETFVNMANKRRVVRALEVQRLTGRPFSSFRAEWERRAPIPIAALDAPPDVLDRRIRARLRQQLDAGLLAETRALLDRGLDRSPTARTAIPYPDAVALLEGRIDEATFIEQAARANRRLARRQRAWFRADPRVRWFDATQPERAGADIRAYFERHPTEEHA